jgi:hypothetical protein
MLDLEIQQMMMDLSAYIMLAFVCIHGGVLTGMTHEQVHGPGTTPTGRLTTSKQARFREDGAATDTTVTSDRMGRTRKLPLGDPIFIPDLGPRGGGSSSSVREYRIEAAGPARGGYAMQPEGDFQLVAATLIMAEQYVCVRWRSTLYKHVRHMNLPVSYLMFRALMTLEYWDLVRISMTHDEQ